MRSRSLISIIGTFLLAQMVVVPSAFAAPSCGGKTATVVGTDEADELEGTEGTDVISGLGGDDVVNGNGGNDVICGDDGTDSLMGGEGDDLILGGAGDDSDSIVISIYIQDEPVQYFLDKGGLYGGPGSDKLDGEEGGDSHYGDAGADNLSGGAGDDFYSGGKGPDVITDTSSAESMYGDAGNDSLTAGPGENHLDGGAGNDQLDAGGGDNSIYGDDGDDVMTGGNEGGYFNGGLGILLLAHLSLFGLTNLNAMNALKNLLSAALTTIAVATYAAGGAVHWAEAATMTGATVAGGYLGAHHGRRLPARLVRPGIVAIGFAMAMAFFFG